MFALVTFVVLAPLVIGLWLLVWVIEGIGRLARGFRHGGVNPTAGSNRARVLKPREHRAVSELRRAVTEYNEDRVATVARRRDEPVFTGEYRTRVLNAERRLDASKRTLARALDGYRDTCAGIGFDVSTVPQLMTANEAEDAVLLAEAERELDLELAS